MMASIFFMSCFRFVERNTSSRASCKQECGKKTSHASFIHLRRSADSASEAGLVGRSAGFSCTPDSNSATPGIGKFPKRRIPRLEKLDLATGIPLEGCRLMKKFGLEKTILLIPASARAAGAGRVCALVRARVRQTAGAARAGNRPGAGQRTGGSANPVLAGKLIPVRRPAGESSRRVAAVSRAEPGRHQPRNRQASRAPGSPPEPRELWAIDVGEGYAGAAVLNGRVYLMDYDRDKKQDALRCLSLADGREIWRFAYPVPVKRNHGMSRTVPAVTDKLVVAMGPKCHVVCLDPATGELRWGLDLVRQFGDHGAALVCRAVPAG